jgi:hypothetical protein
MTNRRSFFASIAAAFAVVPVAASAAPAIKPIPIPAGWKWFEVIGQRVFPYYASNGALEGKCAAFAYDPHDSQINKDGDLGAAVKRGTAKEFRFGVKDMPLARQLTAEQRS